LPAFATAIAFAHAWMHWGSPFAIGMAQTIQLEFLVIHAGLFFGVFILVPVSGGVFRALRWIPVVLLAYLYGRGAHSLLGWYGVASIASIFIATYAGLLLAPLSGGARPHRGRAVTEIGVRWGIAFLGYGLLGRALGLPQQVNEWIAYREAVALGALYFLLLAVVECTALYPRLRGEAQATDAATGGPT